MSKEKNKIINELKSETGKDNLPEFCKACGDKIIHKQNRNNKIFCSDNCRMKWWNANLDKVKRKAYYDKVCFYCRRAFTVYGRSGAKFCARVCYDTWKSAKKK